MSSLALAWSDRTARLLLAAGLAAYVVMRVWSGIYFIPEMLAFQKIPPNALPSAELSARVARWTFWSWFRELLDLTAAVCWFLALYCLKRH